MFPAYDKNIQCNEIVIAAGTTSSCWYFLYLHCRKLVFPLAHYYSKIIWTNLEMYLEKQN